ncbi:uncharacterized protein [Hetaerina americana]|uniref:uncharacterized protein n=1 Tax=Hetaerina americana TaxID=62018 RepID=UPI003A7F3814
MCDKIDFVVCRLCLNSGGVLINIFDKNNKSEFMLENTIEDLINVKVVEDANYPWLICSNCIEKLTEFRLFKHRCEECLFVYYNRIQKGFNPVTEGWLTNRQEEVSDVLTQDNNNPREHMVDGTSDKVWSSSSTVESAVHSVGTASVEMKNPYSPVHGMNFMAVNNCNEVNIQLPGEIKKEIEDVTIASDAVDSSEVDVQDDMIIVKEEIDTTSGCSVPLKIDTGSSVHEDDSHWLDNEDSSHLDPLEYAEIYMPPEEEVHIKEDCDADIPQMEVRLGGNMLQEQDDYQKQDNAGENASATQPNVCKICNKVFDQKDLLKDHMPFGRYPTAPPFLGGLSPGNPLHLDETPNGSYIDTRHYAMEGAGN